MKEVIKNCLLCKNKFRSYQNSNRKFCCLSHSYTYRLVKSYLKSIKIIKLKTNHPFVSWLAGFWEGEGYLGINYKNRYYRIDITQKDKIILNKIKLFLKIGSVIPHSQIKKCYNWRCEKLGNILSFLILIQPHVRIKKRQLQINNFLKSRRIKELLRYVK